MFVVNGKNGLKDGFRVMCESQGGALVKDYIEVISLGAVPGYASVSLITKDSFVAKDSDELARVNLTVETARRFAETLLAFLDTLE